MISRRWLVALLVVFALSMASVAFARGAPTTKKAFSPAATVESVTPSVADVPAIAGHEAVLNLTTKTQILATSKQYGADTSASSRLSTTVDWRFINASGYDSTTGNRSMRAVLRA